VSKLENGRQTPSDDDVRARTRATGRDGEPAGDGRFVLYSYGNLTKQPAQGSLTGLAIGDRVTGRAALCYSRDPSNPATKPILLPRPDGYSRPFVTWEEHGSLVLLDLRSLT
jgi:hypothetical protein